MKNAELIAALRCEKDCDNCAYHTDNAWSRCDEWGMRCDAADAIEAADKRIAELESWAIHLLKQLPKEGEWIRHGAEDEFEYYECPLCGLIGLNYHYCPNCGARMKTVTDCHTLEEGERC